MADFWNRRMAVAIGAILVAFVVALLPYASTFVNHHIDEYHYVESAMRMAATGDWLIPATDEGDLRLFKPILPYWLVAAGMAVFGESVLGARAFWVLGGLAMIVLTVPLAQAAGLGRRGALLAAALTAGNLCLLNAAVATTPDVPQAVFLTLAMVGLMQTATSAAPPAPWTVWVFWLGIALAALSKGLLALVFLGYAAVGLAVLAPRRLLWLCRPLPILAAVLLVGGWFGYVAVHHGAVLAEQFLGDQVTDKLAPDPAHIIRQVFLHVAYLAMAAFPWVLLAPVAWWLGRHGVARPAQTRVAWLLLLWVVVVVTVFAFKAWSAWLYFLSAMPVLSVLVAIGISRLPEAGAARRWMLGLPVAWAVFVVLVVGGVAGLVAFQIAPVWQAVAGTLIFAGYLALLWRVRRGPNAAVAVALMPLAVFLGAAPTALSLGLPDRGAAVAAFAATLDPVPETYVMQHPPRVRSELRLALGTRAPVLRAGDIDASVHCEADMVIAITEAALTPLIGCGMRVAAIKIGWRTIDVPEFFRAAAAFRLAEARENRRDLVWVAYRGF